MKFSYLIGVAALSGVMQFASAQSVSTYQSYSDVYFSTDPDVTAKVSTDPMNLSGTYNNLIGPVSTGDGINFPPQFYLDEYYDDNTGALNEVDQFANASSQAGTGSASQFWGEHHFVDFTNNGIGNESVTLTEYVDQYLDASTNGITASLTTGYAGIDVIQNGGLSAECYFTNTQNSNGLQTANYSNFTGGFQGGDYFSGVGTVTFTLAPGETAVVQTWASGSTQVQPAPEPITVGLGIAAVGAVIRKRLKSNA